MAEARVDNMAIDVALNGAPATDSEDRLAERCRNGDTSAFDEIVTRYQLRLFRFAHRLLRSNVEAEDAVQEAFVRAYRAIPAYRPDGYFSSWLYRIALNECRRRMRSRKPTVGLEFAPTVSDAPDPQQTALTSERNRRVREAVEGLPDNYRIVMTLFYFEEMPVDQISKAMGISASAVKVRLHRARLMLQKTLTPVLQQHAGKRRGWLGWLR